MWRIVNETEAKNIVIFIDKNIDLTPWLHLALNQNLTVITGDVSTCEEGNHGIVCRLNTLDGECKWVHQYLNTPSIQNLTLHLLYRFQMNLKFIQCFTPNK